jgi:hypothetical protein
MDNVEKSMKNELYKNRYNNNYLYEDGDMVKYGTEVIDNSYKWELEIAGNGYYPKKTHCLEKCI